MPLNKIILFASLFTAAALTPMIWEIIEDISTYMPKKGQVVDATTGQGLDDVHVIAVATSGAQNLVEGTDFKQLYRVVTLTNAKGEYSIPNQWDNVRIWFPPLPGTKPRVRWIITAFKPGYAVVGDEQAWSFDGNGLPKARPLSVHKIPIVSSQLTSVLVEPISLSRVALSPKESASYYGAIVRAGSGPDEHARKSAAETNLRRTGYDLLTPLVCAMDETEKIDWSIGEFAYDNHRYVSTLGALEKESLERGAAHGKPALISAKNECLAIKKAQEGSP
jgi:hypothetical protein